MDRIRSPQIPLVSERPRSLDKTQHSRNRLWKLLASLGLSSFGWLTLALSPQVAADEPFDRFMARLKDERLFDLATVYLEQQASLGTLSEVQKGAISLERALLLQQSSIFQSKEELRFARLDQAEVSFKEFLDKQPNHPRRGEAKLGLGNLTLARGEHNFLLGTKGAGDPEKLKAAADYFNRAKDLFNSTLQELTPVLNELKGAKVADGDSAKLELREQYRSEYSQAQLLAVYARKRATDCLPSDSPQRKTEFEEVEKAFTAIYLNDTRADGLRNLALFYRGQVQQLLGKTPEALDSFQRIADIVDVPDPMRNLKTRAVTELIKLLIDPAQAKFDTAVAVGEPWAAKINPAEATDADWLALQVTLAQAQILTAKKLREADAGATATKNLEDKARRALQASVKVNGDHQDKARQLLADIGVEPIAAVESNKPVNSFSEALDAAKTKLADIESASLSVEILKQQVAATQDAAEKNKLEAQIQQVQNDSISGMKGVSDLLSRALSLYTTADNRSQLQEARYLLSYTLLRQERFYEAAATASFTTRSSAGENWGLRSGLICLNAYQRLLTGADAVKKEFIFTQLQGLAEYLLKTWPAAEESQQAANLLVQLTLIGGDLDKAKSYVGMVPANTASGGKLRKQLGLSLWDDYNKRLRAAGNDSTDPALVASRQLAFDTLREGVVDGAPAEKADLVSIEAALALIHLWMLDGKMEDASNLLNSPDKGPITLLESNPDLGKDGTTSLRAYQAALQIYIAKLATQNDNSILEKVQATIEKLQSIAGNDEEGQKKLAAVFYRLALDLQQQLETTPDASARDRLASGIAVVLTQLRDSTQDTTTKLWVGQTLTGIAKAVKGKEAVAGPSVKKLTDESIATLDALRKDSTLAQDASTKVRFVMAQAYQIQGNPTEALKLMEDILQQNPMMLDVQLEAARMLQAAGTGKSSDYLVKAVNGYLPNPKTRQNTIWGWGKISQLTSGKPNLTESFFESRLELARCRYLQALLDKTPESRNKLLQKSLVDITQTLKLYPELGGPVFSERFDKLTRDVQRELKQNVVGLKGLTSK